MYLLATMKKNKKYRLLSLFSGCGGMDLGFEGGFKVYKDCISPIDRKGSSIWVHLPDTAFQTVFANDILPEAKLLWDNYFINNHGYSSDVYHLNSIVDLVKLHKSGIQVFPKDIDIVTGGFPCQDFSLAGKRKGFSSNRDHKGNKIDDNTASEETRGKLYMWMKEVIEITQPKIFIAENVKGLVQLDDIKTIIQRDFSSASGDGYIVLPPKVLHAGNYGVPQKRERVIFIGIRKSCLNETAFQALSQPIVPPMYDPYPTPTHYLTQAKGEYKKFVSVGKLLSLLPEPEVSQDWSQKVYSKAKFMGVHCQGQKEIDLDSLSPTIRSEHHGNIEFRRLGASNGGKISKELDNGLIERRLTPRECATIQTFPQEYDFVIPHHKYSHRYLVSPSVAYKVIGNAVPPLLAYHIAKRLEEVWDLYFNV